MVADELQISIRQSALSFETLLILSIFPSLYSHWLSYFNILSESTIGYLNITLLIVASIYLLFLLKYRMAVSKFSGLILIMYVLFSTYATISLFWTSEFDYGVYKSIRLNTVVLFGIVTASLVISKSKIRMREFVNSFIIISTLYTITAFFVVVSTSLAYGQEELSFILTARVAGISVISMLTIVIYSNNQLKQFLGLLILFPAVAVLLLTGTRTPLVALFLVFIVIIVLSIIKNSTKENPIGWHSITSINNYRIFSFVAILISITTAMSINNMRIRDTAKTLDRILKIFSSGATNSLSTRFEFYEKSIQLWSKKPIFGHGLGDLTTHLQSQYPHNIVIEIIGELGLIGLFIFIPLVFLPLLYMMKAYISSKNPEPFFIFFVFLYFIINAFVSGDLSGNRMVFIMAGFTGMAMFK